MSPHESRRRRLATGLLALSAAAAMSVALAAPAGAAVGKGDAVIAPADHSKGRTLSGQGVKLLVGGGASVAGKLTLPIGQLELGAKPSALTGASLTFKRGRKTMVFSDVRFDLAAGTVAGKLDGGEVPIFWLGAAPKVNGAAGSVSLSEGKLRLTAGTAAALKGELGLDRALVRKGVGMIWLAAQASPAHEKRSVTTGALDWGFLTSWREYIYKELGPGSVGSITTEGGATTSGEPAKPGSFFSFPAAGGTLEQGLYGASTRLTLGTQGSVKFAKPGHCIIEIKLSDIAVTLNGAESSLVADLGYDIDKFNGKGCEDLPPVSLPDTTIATLDASGVVPTYSADGKSVTWAGIPATLTAAAAKPFEPQYKAGQLLDPVTISVGLG